MVPDFAKVHNKFKLNREHFTHTQLKEVAYSFVKEGEPYESVLGDFLLDWLDDKDYVIVKTSGSTGLPKIIKLQKQAMVNSAIATGDCFNLEPGFTALHCLPVYFIAGKMMLVRAIILGLELDIVEPSSNPLQDVFKKYDFCAMLPMQLQNSLDKLHKIKTVIIGGASVSKQLQEKIQDISTKVYATYGMTETITHIAVKQLNVVSSLRGETTKQSVEDYYQTLPNITISQDERDCLVIDAPKLNDEIIVTNDIVKLYSETEFEVLGRYDNMINSGGIKLFPEQIETKLKPKMNQRFFIASEKDETLGEKLILVLEGESNNLETEVFEGLDTYEIPKQVYAVTQFKETSTGKIKRFETLKLLK
ncbi:MAG: O-succinylbenzoic acid--CoA ligase [Bacteroidetes bacterium]|nr:MAG: O-succinylbenzoic acid--CoA ligase [Bacteroidota bacterium]